MKNQKGHSYTLMPYFILAAAFLGFAASALQREFWFDEALTLMNFAWMSDPWKIYSSYVIPNNQIIYTICLHFWVRLPDPGLRQDFFLRLPSVIFAVLALWNFYRSFRLKYGRTALITALGALAVSPPFLIYGTALRGYMASAFFVSLALTAAVGWMRRPGIPGFFGYFICCLLCVGTIPSNLLALAGCVLFALPAGGKNFLRLKRSYLLAVVPFAALVLFYLPISKAFAGVCRLGEGWQNGAGVIQAYFITAAIIFGVLWIPAAAALFWGKIKLFRLIPYALLLLPVLAVAVLPTSPFPRVFFPLFPLIALLVAGALRRFSALLRRRKTAVKPFYAVLAVLVLLSGWGLCQTPVLEKISSGCGGPDGDDFFYGYYMRKDHLPSMTAQQLVKNGFEKKLPGIYMSFRSDPWPTMYYLLAAGVESEFLFDGPRGRVRELPSGTLVIINRSESPQTVSERFNVVLVSLFENPKHRVFRVN